MFTQPLEEAIASTRSIFVNVTAEQLDDATNTMRVMEVVGLRDQRRRCRHNTTSTVRTPA